MGEYEYTVSDFQGPLDLLLYLIEKNKVDIYNIPIVTITDQFNEYVRELDGFDVNYASKFFVMAATLLQIKSRLLLPKAPKAADEDEEDPQDVLVRQLVEYKRMKALSAAMGSLWDKRSLMLDRPRTPMTRENHFVGTIDRNALYEAFRSVYTTLAPQKPLEIHISHEIYSVDECMDRIIYRLRQSPRATAVVDIFRPCRSRVELVVTFLAVLELLKCGQCHTISEGEEGNTVALRYTPGGRTGADSAPGSAAIS